MSRILIPKIVLTSEDEREPEPYYRICRTRHTNSSSAYAKQFAKELSFLERMQNKGFDGVKLRREFTRNVLDARDCSRRGFALYTNKNKN